MVCALHPHWPTASQPAPLRPQQSASRNAHPRTQPQLTVTAATNRPTLPAAAQDNTLPSWHPLPLLLSPAPFKLPPHPSTACPRHSGLDPHPTHKAPNPTVLLVLTSCLTTPRSKRQPRPMRSLSSVAAAATSSGGRCCPQASKAREPSPASASASRHSSKTTPCTRPRLCAGTPQRKLLSRRQSPPPASSWRQSPRSCHTPGTPLCRHHAQTPGPATAQSRQHLPL